MDILAHGLWTNILYRKIPQTRNDRKIIWWGILFGILPDLISFTPVFVYAIWQWGFGGKNVRTWPPDVSLGVFRYAESSYNYTHSFVVWIVVLVLLWSIARKFPWYVLGAFLHILIDLFTHPDFYRTPFLFPISSYRNPYAISWAHPVFMAINYGLLLVIYLFLVPKLKSSRLFQKQ
jgi:hypothetical protein